MSHLETHRTWYFGAPSQSDFWLCPRMPSPQPSWPAVRTSDSTEEEERDTPTVSGAVFYSREAASRSWKRAPRYTTAARRLQRQRLRQQTQHFKAVATIVGSNREERSCLWVPKANWESQKLKQDPEESYWETMRKNPLIYVEQKPESSRNSPSCFHIQSIFSLAHMEWASANFLPQTFLSLTILTKKQDS